MSAVAIVIVFDNARERMRFLNHAHANSFFFVMISQRVRVRVKSLLLQLCHNLTHCVKIHHFFPLFFTGCRCSSLHYHESAEKSGSISMDVEFSQPLTENIQLLTYSIHHRGIRISKFDREVTLDL